MAEQGDREHAPHDAPTPHRRRRTFVAALVALAVVLGLGAFVLWEYRGKLRGHAPPAPAAAEPLRVSVVEMAEERAPLRPTYLGRSEASESVQIRARVSGYLEERAFEEGSSVQAGDLLFRLDAQPFRAALAAAQARLENARARADLARRNVERLERAASEGAATASELDDARTEHRVALAEVTLQEALVEQAELEFGYTTITAPIAGVVGRALVDVGAYVDGAQDQPLAILRQVDPIDVVFTLSEAELLRWRRLISAGEVEVPPTNQIRVAVELIDGTPHPYEGRLDFVDVEVALTTGTATARAVVPNPDNLLRPGQFVRVSTLDIVRTRAILVPQRAVLQAPDGASVYVVDEEGAVERRTVTLGDWVGDRWLVASGLRPGDRVAVDHLLSLRPGMRVEAVAAGAGGPAPAAPQERGAND